MSKKLTKDIASEEEKIEEKAVKKVAKKVSKTPVKSADTKATKKATTEKAVEKTDAKKDAKETKVTPKKAVTKKEKVSKKDDKKEVEKETKRVTKKVSKTTKALEKEEVKDTSLPEEKPKKRGRPRKVALTEEIKETKKEPEKIKEEKTKTTKKASAKKTTKIAKKDDAEPKAKAKKVTKTTTSKKATTKKATSASTKKKTATKKSSTKKTSKTKKDKRTIRFVKTLSLSKQYLKKNTAILEYFDLPYRYNETTVKVLAQTPKVLFVYWDISDHDRDQYKLNYGEDFFDTTYPVLLLKNESKGYVEEIPINDFANSWYIHISDPRSKYSIELGRKYKNMPKFESPYIYIKESNEIIAPNDHVLLEEIKPKIKYKNAKTNEVIFKNISNVIKDGKILDFYSLYQVLYNVEDINEFFTLNNPSSGNPTSTFK